MDYIFANAGDIHTHGGGWVVKQARVGMMMRHPELGCSLSDHFSVEATLAFHPHQPASLSPAPESDATTAAASKDGSSPTATTTLHPTSSPTTNPEKSSQTDSALHNGAYLQLQSPPPSSTHLPDTTYTSQLHSFLHPSPSTSALAPSAYDTILAQIQSYTARERSQQTWRGRHFFASVLVTVACLVGVWFTPDGKNYISFILVLVSTLGLTAGTIDGLMALLFFSSELRALKEFEWEVRNARRGVFGGGGGVEEGEGERAEGGSW